MLETVEPGEWFLLTVTEEDIARAGFGAQSCPVAMALRDSLGLAEAVENGLVYIAVGTNDAYIEFLEEETERYTLRIRMFLDQKARRLVWAWDGGERVGEQQVGLEIADVETYDEVRDRWIGRSLK